MDKSEIIEKLDGYQNRLQSDVVSAYAQKGRDFGRERFAAWELQIEKFLDSNLPGESSRLKVKLKKFARYRGFSESDLDVFLREDFQPCVAFIESLKLDVENGEFEQKSKPTETIIQKNGGSKQNLTKIFVVHGHDELLKTKTARFIEKLGYEAVILHEQASRGMTIIEKIETYTNVGFAIVLYSPDDRGSSVAEADKGTVFLRARQNVIFEHGYLIAKLTRARVVPLVSGKLELPSDISGIVYIDNINWQMDIAKEMKAAGYQIDFNKLVDT